VAPSESQIASRSPRREAAKPGGSLQRRARRPLAAAGGERERLVDPLVDPGGALRGRGAQVALGLIAERQEGALWLGAGPQRSGAGRRRGRVVGVLDRAPAGTEQRMVGDRHTGEQHRQLAITGRDLDGLADQAVWHRVARRGEADRGEPVDQNGGRIRAWLCASHRTPWRLADCGSSPPRGARRHASAR
jgi:hypothetical protein